jgi:hypothetical protein
MNRNGGVPARLIGWVFYGGLVLLLGLILANALGNVLPAALARRVGYNSEGYLFALVVAAWIQFARPRLTGARKWPVTLAVAVLCLVVGVALLNSDLPSRFKTLNEPMIALAVVIPYVVLRRPVTILVALVPPLILGGIVAGMILDPEGLVINLAETFGYWMLVPLAFDVVDRGILDPDATTSPRLRYPFYAVLAAIPITVSALGFEERTGGGIHAWLSYAGRIHESFIGVLLIVLLFAVGLGRTGRTGNDETVAQGTEIARPTAAH